MPASVPELKQDLMKPLSIFTASGLLTKAMQVYGISRPKACFHLTP
jgi:hypothetical protein